MDKNLKLIILVGAGGVGVWLTWKYLYDNGYLQKWFPTWFAPTPATAGATDCAALTALMPDITGAGVVLTDVQKQAICAGGNAALTPSQQAQMQAWINTKPKGSGMPPAATNIISKPIGPGYLPTDYVPCTGGTAVWNSGPDANSANYRSTPQSASAVKCIMPVAPTPHACPPGFTWDPTQAACTQPTKAGVTFCDTNTPGWAIDANNQCSPVQAAAATLTTMQQMQAAAGVSSLTTDEWCFYYTQITGSDCPVDPGTIPPQVYHDAGVYAVDGSIGADGTPNPGDRTTPTDIGTWYALMQNQNPGFALSGLGAFSRSRLAMEWAA